MRSESRAGTRYHDRELLHDRIRPVHADGKQFLPQSSWRRSSTTFRCRAASSNMSHKRARRRLRSFFSTFALATLAAGPATAVQIPFTNCLPDSYQNNNPTLLQWVPLYADAKFDTESSSHNLEVVIWGNVTGSRENVKLPPPGNPYWENNNETPGKIIQNPEPDSKDPRATTLIRRVNVATFEPWTQAVDFCRSALVNGECPLAPVFPTGSFRFPDDLPSMNLSHNFSSSYAFTSFTNTLLLIYGDSAKTNIGCISTTVTPDLGNIASLLKFLPLVILLLTGVAVVFAAIMSPWGTTDIFHWTSNYGRDADLLRLVTPGFGDCLQYIQFIALTGGLSLNYPGFYQPVVSQAAWSALMFNESFVAKADPWQSVVDGIYVTNASYGLTELGQLVGMAESEDIWAGMMVWLCVIIVAVSVLIQIGFLIQWVYRKIRSTSEEDLRAKNIPFAVGNVVRIVFNFFLLPIVALSTYQLVVASSSPDFTVALAVLTIVVLIGFTSWLLFLIIRTKPKSVLFDDLPTVLQYGPLYNTYADEVAPFALVPVLLTFLRGIAIGAVQPSGIAQVVLLAICEVIQILTIYAFRPFSSPTSMNVYHTIFSGVRLITIMLMVAFTPTLGVTDGARGWIGYVILLLHACVLVFAFFLASIITMFEVVARMMGAGGDDARGLQRGGLNKIFGMRQLSRRAITRGGPSRASQLSTSAMLDNEDGSKQGYAMPSGRLRSESAASMGGMALQNRNRTSSAMDSIDMFPVGHRQVDSGSSFGPGTPGGTSNFSYLPSPTLVRGPLPPNAAALEASDPYYRPPRRRRETQTDSIDTELRRGSLNADVQRLSQNLGPTLDPADAAGEISRNPTPAPGAQGSNAAFNFPANRPDYATREVDFYYGVRGPALNSEGPGRKLGTGPADPTGPVATATGWFRTMFGGKSKEKGKGFEVVRSARMPPAMVARNGGFGDETPPEGIPVAMGVLRNGPIDSDDDEPATKPSPRHREGDLLTDSGEPGVAPDADEPESPIEERLPRGFGSERRRNIPPHLDLPEIPRKSSKRHSGIIDPLTPSLPPVETIGRLSVDFGEPASISSASSLRGDQTSRLPFERTGSQQRLSMASSLDFPGDLTASEIPSSADDRPASFGRVPQHGISRVEPGLVDVDLLGSSAELIDNGGTIRTRTR
ncbi:hypothetical protein NLU13_1795 [Sarocladium strictum]|uniref:ML-like domain-containing protein n=1 Tax=Sarocladium strictum TaxID=5046 RepID=A0AA39LCU9_SARSR|nr:hypothetical protein NLU13_1795 [Sarocladium strictum]